MAIPTWPVTLPQTLDVQGYSHQSADTVLRTSMDAGPAKTRRRFSAGVEPIAGTMLVTLEQLNTLRAFYDSTLLGGSLRFSWRHPLSTIDPGSLTLSLDFAEQEYQQRIHLADEFKFTAPPQWTAVGIYFRVSLQLEFLPGRPDGLLDYEFGNLITFTRASSGTYVDSAGVIQMAATNEPRFDHDPDTLAPLGLLVEEQRTNLALHSEAFDNAGWGKGDATVTANQVIAPDGVLSADEVECTETGDFSGRVTQSFSLSVGDVVAFSFYAKYVNNAWISATVGMSNNKARRVWWNIQDGLIGGTTVAFTGGETLILHKIAPAGGGWYRCTVAVNPNAETALNIFVQPANNDVNVGATAGQKYYLWGAQLEEGAFPTSYIPTAGQQATRAVDGAYRSNIEFFNRTAGTFFVEHSRQVSVPSDEGNRCPFSIRGDGPSIEIRSPAGTSSTRRRAFVHGAFSPVSGGLESLVGEVMRDAVAWSGSAATYQSDAAAPLEFEAVDQGTVHTILVIGARAVGSDVYCGHIRKLSFYPRALSAAELEALTA